MLRDTSAAALDEYLARYHLEQAIPPDVRTQVELLRFAPGEFLCRAGAPLEQLHIIVDGRCKVVPLSEEGKTIVLAYLSPTDLNGDIELYNDTPSMHSVCALNHVAAIAIDREVLFSVMMENNAFLQMLCKSFAGKLYRSSQDHSSTMLYSIRSRAARYLLDQMAACSSQEMRIKMDELAQYLGVTTRHLRRVLSDFEEKGIIKRTYGTVTIENLPVLNDMAAYY